MSATSDAILVVLTQIVKAALDTPAGQELLSAVEEEALKAAPGAAGAFLRALALCVPHDVESLGFKKDGPG